ncbi:hypothetical protein Ciccas_012832, partial [Cichlidogyrus casuarinus]
MLCGKMGDNTVLRDFIFQSPAPPETAAKLAARFKMIALKEQERARDLKKSSVLCEDLCLELVTVATHECDPVTLFGAVSHNDEAFIDILVECNLKEVISNPAVQSYLSYIWDGVLNWGFGHYLALIAIFVTLPPAWMILSLPTATFARYNQIPAIKYMIIAISYFWMVVLLVLTAVEPLTPVAIRTDLVPTWAEFLLVIWISGMVVSELVNRGSSGGLFDVRFGSFFLIIISFFIHLIGCFFPVNVPELLYVRNLLISVAFFLSLFAGLDFLSISGFYGAFSLIIVEIIKEIVRFSVIFIIFIISFACIITAIDKPVFARVDNNGVPPLWSRIIDLYFTIFGEAIITNLPSQSLQPAYAQTLLLLITAAFMFISVVVLLNLLI